MCTDHLVTSQFFQQNPILLMKIVIYLVLTIVHVLSHAPTYAFEEQVEIDVARANVKSFHSKVLSAIFYEYHYCCFYSHAPKLILNSSYVNILIAAQWIIPMNIDKLCSKKVISPD